MLYATAAIMYGAMSITLGRTTRNSLATLVTGIIIAVSIAHFYINDVKTFRRTFLAMLLSVLFQCIWLLSARVPDAKVKRAAQYLALYGTGKIVAACENTVLTNIRHFCVRLHTLEHRQQVLRATDAGSRCGRHAAWILDRTSWMVAYLDWNWCLSLHCVH